MGSYIIIFLLIAVLAVLIAGIFLMGKGGAANSKYGNKLMVARVSLQGMILVVLMLMYFVGVK